MMIGMREYHVLSMKKSFRQSENWGIELGDSKLLKKRKLKKLEG